MVKIYGLVCPFSGDIRYIGKTSQPLRRRLGSHLAEARKKANCHRQRWLRLCLEADMPPEIFLLEEIEAGVDWQEREITWIARAKAMGLDLTNQTIGGEGVHLDCPEAKARLRKNLAKAMKKLRATPEFKAAQSEGLKRAWVTNRDTILSAITSPESKAKQSVSKKAAWARPEVRKRLIDGRWTPEAKAAQAQRIKDRGPDYKAAQSARMKEVWASRSKEKRESMLSQTRRGKTHRNTQGA